MPFGKKKGIAKRKGSLKTHKQALRGNFAARHIDQVWDDVHSPADTVLDAEAHVGPVGTSSRQQLDADVPGLGQWPCTPCSRYFVDEAALLSHRRTKPHKRRCKELQGPRPHDQKEADWAGGVLPAAGPRQT